MPHFDENIRPDVEAVLDAAAILDTTEYHIFQLAYLDWYGSKSHDRVLEPYFTSYMFSEHVPIWVRQYSRKVLELDQQGRLEPMKLGVWKPLPSRRMMVLGRLYTLGLLLVMLFFTYAALTSPEEVLRVVRQCYFPPCY